jgi:hypothetical protein
VLPALLGAAGWLAETGRFGVARSMRGRIADLGGITTNGGWPGPRQRSGRRVTSVRRPAVTVAVM